MEKTTTIQEDKQKLLEHLKTYVGQMVDMKKDMAKGKTMDFLYLGQEDFIMRNGQVFESGPYPEAYLEHRGEKKECFRNAGSMSLYHPGLGLTYCEGYALSLSLPFPIHHGWVIDKDEKVIDPTWDNQEECLYYGVKFSTDYVRRTIIESGHWGIIDNWAMDFPLLTGKHKDFKP